ncbi:MAG TPA: L-serine ammonia-lyase, partial [Pseudomonas sp.]|nr:L-serine ammonia-lyase [Pseudomonas sp.]
FDLFKIGIGPSSSHTVGPMRAARLFVEALERHGVLQTTARVRVELYGSLSATGRGHGTVDAILLGLCGETPEAVDPDLAAGVVARVRREDEIALWRRGRNIRLRLDEDLLFMATALPQHPNGMRLSARDSAGIELLAQTYFSIGGGFIVAEDQLGILVEAEADGQPLAFASAAELLALCDEHGKDIAGIMWARERLLRDDSALRDGLLGIWRTMSSCIDRGMRTGGHLPGPLGVRRRAADLFARLGARGNGRTAPEAALDWLSLYAMAVNEENACGGRVVTAPTNGAAGIIPAVIRYYLDFVPGADEDGVIRFLLTAAAIGILYKLNASISGAEVGCQGEVGVACSMAAAGLCAVLGGTPTQVENAAEIGMEHHLGLTCDPVGGRVQIPCIERNAMGAVKAVNAARIALFGDGQHVVSLDAVIRTMKQTGADMQSKYKETSQGGLAVNIIEC